MASEAMELDPRGKRLPPAIRDAVAHVRRLLLAPTPEAWVSQAAERLELLLVDHAHCERKAAATALSLMHRYPERTDLVDRLSRLAREELRHFEQVLAIIQRRGGRYQALTASRYAGGLHQAVRREEPGRLVDQLLVGAYIEARSCERFALMVPELEARGEDQLASFYAGLLASEARHFETYLEAARRIADDDLAARIQEIGELEARLVTEPDAELRFHSGPPPVRR